MATASLFTEPNIQQMFGPEAAEDEDISRLRKYYIKSKTYEQVFNETQLRIVVSHKGVGKSALFTVARNEARNANTLTVFIRPDNVLDVATSQTAMVEKIEAWRVGLRVEIVEQVFDSLGIAGRNWSNEIDHYRGSIESFISNEMKRLIQQGLLANSLVTVGFLERPKIWVFVDDLDRGWSGERSGVERISALLNAIRDINRQDRCIQFRVALRADVYYLVRTSDESTDKIEGSVIWLSWNHHEIYAMLAKRIAAFFGDEVAERELLNMYQQTLTDKYLSKIMAPVFCGYGAWEDVPTHRVLMSMIRKRPRDLVKLCTMSAREAYKRSSSKINTQDIQNILALYSEGRIRDTVNEYCSELPSIERLILNMKPTKKEKDAKTAYNYSTEDLLSKLKNIQQSHRFIFASGQTATPKELAHFLYKINFITARKDLGDRIQRLYFEENQYIMSSVADFGYHWEVHPAFRWALQPDDLRSIYATIATLWDDKD